ncbi:yjeF N-terminal domain-containing protein, partial [Sarcoptes scabiei]
IIIIYLFKFFSQNEAIQIDQELFDVYKFSIDQLMELAGLSVACSIVKSADKDPVYSSPANVLVVCGPGNNGGDGLVAARHLKLFGYNITVFYPKKGKNQLFENLMHQCRMMDIDFVDEINSLSSFRLIVDAVFGFSYKPPLRSQFYDILDKMSAKNSDQRLISIDIPSGWHVEDGPPVNETSESKTPILKPDCLISLTAPKECSKHYRGSLHWLGGRFVPKSLEKKYQLNLPDYFKENQCVLLEENV